MLKIIGWNKLKDCKLYYTLYGEDKELPCNYVKEHRKDDGTLIAYHVTFGNCFTNDCFIEISIYDTTYVSINHAYTDIIDNNGIHITRNVVKLTELDTTSPENFLKSIMKIIKNKLDS